ncbi:hypothetical protein [Paenarthrobacter nitroguajacolicus]|uniref:hypothetical protein n=1 Tax=Paenarthrobacter nitroguajacolicus TaxID=211146 RepID=UPI0015C055B4|nr:hypothetical protein [Paenarthrobacter nitroguajacolicus]
MGKLRKVIITIEASPKDGQVDKLHEAIWKAIEKHTKRKNPQSRHTSFIYDEGER